MTVGISIIHRSNHPILLHLPKKDFLFLLLLLWVLLHHQFILEAGHLLLLFGNQQQQQQLLLLLLLLPLLIPYLNYEEEITITEPSRHHRFVHPFHRDHHHHHHEGTGIIINSGKSNCKQERKRKK